MPTETKIQHTPGPWKLEADPDYSVNGRQVFNQVTAKAFDGSWKQICRVSGGSPDSRDANARLIAAAPRLLEALYALDAGFVDGSIRFTKKRQSDSDPYHPANTLMCEAIAEAEGR